MNWPLVFGLAAVGTLVIGGVAYANSQKTAAPLPPAPPGTTPTGPQVISVGPSWHPAQMTAKVGDSIHVIDTGPYSATAPNGFALYAAPTVAQQTDPSTFKVIGPGTIHIAWGAGTTAASSNVPAQSFPAGEVYITVS